MEAQVTESIEQVDETEAVIDYKSLYEESQKDIAKIAAKKEELYKETKRAKQEREAAISAHQKEVEDKALKDGEFEKLWQTTKKEKDDLEKKLKDITLSSRNEKIQIFAMKIATELADGDNAELLSEFIQKNLGKLADEAGGLSSDVLEAVKSEFKNNGKFKALLRVSKAVGGGATGNTRGAQEQQTLTRAEFAKLNPLKQSEFASKIRAGTAILAD
jgi:hypothetical protein